MLDTLAMKKSQIASFLSFSYEGMQVLLKSHQILR